MDIINQHNNYNVKWFKRMAPVYDHIEFIIRGLRGKVAKKVRIKNARILDAACGTGNQSIAFAEAGFSVVGIDLSPDMLRLATKKGKDYDIKFICGDATNINFPDSSFDVSSVSFGLHDMPQEVALAALREMIRVTKSNGQIIIVDYYTPMKKLGAKLGNIIAKTWESRYYDHFRQVGLEQYLDEVNLKPIHKEDFLLNNIQIVECRNSK
jgi:demethylmenaquinone methyltransferase/2-methoxy-6-polyprenyl-1,4-benzoquinol methylase